MIQFKPFRGIRPAKNKASLVPTQNIDHYSKQEIKKELKENPCSFMQILSPMITPNELDYATKYERVRSRLEDFLRDEILVQDRKSFYVYQQEKADGTQFTGVLGVINMDDYKQNQIKRHEATIQKRVENFANYLKNVHFQSDPILLTTTDFHNIELIMSMSTRNTPTLEFTDQHETVHRLWQMKDRLIMKQMKDAVEKLDALYIADGHHRTDSASRYTEAMRKDDPEYFGMEAYNFAMGIVIPGNQLNILDYNRLIKDLNGFSTEEFLEKIGKVFSVIDKSAPYYPSHKHHISMYLDGKFYGLYVDRELRGKPEGLGELDTFLWEEHLMKPILGIENSRTDERVQFLRGTGDIEGILKLKEKVDSGEYKVAFGFYPVAVQDLQLIADLGCTMPPKSTYIEPKLLTAFTLFDMKD